MLQNAYLLAKIGADTAENEQHFAEILPTDGAAVPPRVAAEKRLSTNRAAAGRGASGAVGVRAKLVACEDCAYARRER